MKEEWIKEEEGNELDNRLNRVGRILKKRREQFMEAKIGYRDQKVLKVTLSDVYVN